VSPDGLRWIFAGVSIDEPATWSAYSGCVRARGGLWDAWLTRHEESTTLESQWRLTSSDQGASWSAPQRFLGPQRNLRDPFLVEDVYGDRLMLLAAPCDWARWREDPPSRLLIFREEGGGWTHTGDIGPWSPPGVMWEVPALMRTSHGDLLLMSLLDRRGDASVGSVRAWAGRLHAGGFERRPDWPLDGVRVDLGPDFYAMIPSTPSAGEDDLRWVAWLSSWATARRMPWPGMSGGPISSPRRLDLAAAPDSLAHRPVLRSRLAPGVREAFRVPASAPPVAGLIEARFGAGLPFRLSLASDHGAVDVCGDPAGRGLELQRTGADWLDWQSGEAAALQTSGDRMLTLLVDGPAIEIFLEPDGLAASFALPNADTPFRVTLTVDGRPADPRYAELGT
jgi:hypothetical protein